MSFATVLLDTNIVIDLLRDEPLATSGLPPRTRQAISIATWIEVLVGVDMGRDSELRKALHSFELLPLSPAIADTTVLIRRSYRLKLPDAIIYATAQAHGLILVTRNTRDFHEGMPGVRIPYRL